MFKKIFFLTLLVGVFAFISNTATAQLNFYNGTNCTVRVQSSGHFGGNPCLAPNCASNVISIGPFSSGTMTVPMCTIGVTPNPSYRAVRFVMTGGINGGADICVSPTFNFTDCQGTPRTLQIISNNFAAIF